MALCHKIDPLPNTKGVVTISRAADSFRPKM